MEGYQSNTLPFGSQTQATHLLHFYPQPESSIGNIQDNLLQSSLPVPDPHQRCPFELQSLESRFSCLNLSSSNPQSSFPGSSVGFVPGSRFGNNVNRYGIGRQGLVLSSSMQERQCNEWFHTLNLRNNDCSSTSFVPTGFLQGCETSRMMVRPAFCSTSHRHSFLNRNEFLGDLRRGDDTSRICSSNLNGFFGGSPTDFNGVSVPRNHNYPRTSVNNRRSHRLQDALNSMTLRDLRGSIVNLAKDQCGCRFLQSSIDDNSQEEIEMIFKEVINHIGDLMVDPSGNYVVQKLVEKGSDEQRNQILLMVTRNDFQLVSICLDSHGTRAIQKLLKYLQSPLQVSMFLSALHPGIVALTKNVNGHHVIQYCLEHFTAQDNQCILNAVADDCYSIATNQCGCCVLQHCIEFSYGDLRERLVAEITANALQLSEDRFGNYVVQYILGLREPHITANLLGQLNENFAYLSRNKYGSHVVQKCLKDSGEQHSLVIIMELLQSPDFSMTLLDPYGNYVIQSALSESKGFIHTALVNQVRANSSMLRSNKYGKKVLAWFEKKNP